MNGFDTPQPDQIAQVLQLLNSGQRVFVHCKLGKDRTGTVIAAYRIAHDGWTSDKALDEALTFGMHWYSGGMKRFIQGYQPPAKSVADAVAAPLAQPAAAQP
jgi:protein tyrosine/serine phosphatase